ncbi:SPW repeat protein [Amycolatopsis anabasis]|uniref:SPW repeat protein n=1 Tax=Amycolatopsis anabasis TaxID=1840409 RepID=UPI00131E3E77|nr:SPW repeat protein [Amycolatopsis anabasis]
MTRVTERATYQEPTRAREGVGQPGQGTPTGLATGTALLAGLYLVLSPWVIEFTGQFSLATSNMITGLALALLATGCARSAGLRAIAWVIPVLGAWVIGSPWAVSRGSGVVQFDQSAALPLNTATWLSNVIAGAVVLIAGLALVVRSKQGRTRR